MALPETLGTWLSRMAGEPVTVVDMSTPGSAGFSSETLVVTCEHAGVTAEYVVRRPPSPTAFPLFPVYDFDRQVAAMRLVRDRTDVPVPAILGVEPDPAVLGAPFFVMERCAGEAADNPPYVFAGWLLDAPTAVRDAVSGSCIDLLAEVHGIADLPSLRPFEFGGAGSALRRHVEHTKAHYDWAVGSDRRVPLIETAFDWIEANWPGEAEPALSWGDARPANILWHDGRPTAVLDWEMVAVAPPEVDLGWMLFFQVYFQDIAARSGRPGLPDFLCRDESVARYERATGRPVLDLDWYLTYAALRQAVTSVRVTARRTHRGEAARPDDPDDAVLHRSLLERALSDPAATWRDPKGVS